MINDFRKIIVIFIDYIICSWIKFINSIKRHAYRVHLLSLPIKDTSLWRIKIVIACLWTILRDESQTIGNSLLRSSSPKLKPTNQPTITPKLITYNSTCDQSLCKHVCVRAYVYVCVTIPYDYNVLMVHCQKSAIVALKSDILWVIFF